MGCVPALDLPFQRQRLFLPQHIDRELVATAQSLDSTAEIVGVGHLGPVQGGDDIAGLQAGGMRSGRLLDRRDEHSVFRAKIFGELTCQR